MNNVRFHCTGESVSAVACGCGVTNTSLRWGSMGLPALFSPKKSHQRTMIRCMKAEYFGPMKGVAAIYALLWGEVHVKEIDTAVTSTPSVSKYCCWPLSMSKLFNFERLQQESHRSVRCGAAVLCACDVMLPKASMGGVPRTTQHSLVPPKTTNAESQRSFIIVLPTEKQQN